MNSKFVLTIIGLVTVSLFGCSTKTPLDYRWAKIEPPSKEGQYVPPHLSVSSIPTDPASKVKPKDLSDRTGAAYFEQLGKLSTKAEDFIALADMSLGNSSENIDTTSFDRNLVISVSKSSFNPGDRLVFTKITIKPSEYFKFSNYTIASTAYSTVNIDNINNTKATSYSADFKPSISVAGSPAGVGDVNATVSNSTVDTAQISQQVEQLTAYIEDGNLIIYRESERGIDLTGTTLLKLTLKVKDPDKASNIQHRFIVTDSTLYDKDSKPLNPGKASLNFASASLLVPTDIAVDANIEYITRHIVDGADTYSESDDTVQFVSNSVPFNKFIIISKDETAIPVWTLLGTNDVVLYASTSYGIKQVLFNSYRDALLLKNWLAQTNAVAVGNIKFYISNSGDTIHKTLLNKNNYPEFKIKRL